MSALPVVQWSEALEDMRARPAMIALFLPRKSGVACELPVPVFSSHHGQTIRDTLPRVPNHGRVYVDRDGVDASFEEALIAAPIDVVLVEGVPGPARGGTSLADAIEMWRSDLGVHFLSFALTSVQFAAAAGVRLEAQPRSRFSIGISAGDVEGAWTQRQPKTLIVHGGDSAAIGAALRLKSTVLDLRVVIVGGGQ